jgi:hypothetical protein
MNFIDFWFILWGIFIAFGLQVLYDGIGECPHYTRKFWGGLSVEIVFLIILILGAYSIGCLNLVYTLFATIAFLMLGIATFLRTIFPRT